MRMHSIRRITVSGLRQLVINKNCKRFCSDDEAIRWPRKIFSGIQPTGSLHIGNYLGAVKKWVELQDAGEDVTFCIVDLHSITLPQDPAILKQNTLKLTATMIACGIDPTKSTLFVQSSIRQHAELNWVLMCLTTMARLAHLPQYKEKTQKLKDIPLGLFVYPVLQSADIMLYKATHVPVGEDQIQHIQLAQHLAKIFNYKYGTTFPRCQAIIDDDNAARIRSLRDPTKKMSKSDTDPKSCIFITDEPQQIIEKIKKALTDFTSEVTYNPEERLGVSNLLAMHSLVTGKSIEDICKEAQSIDTGRYKLTVADAIIEHIDPIRLRINDLLKNPDYLVYLLDMGREKAQEIAERTMIEVKEKVGLGSSTDFTVPAKLVNEL